MTSRYESALSVLAEKRGKSVAALREELQSSVGSYPKPGCLEPDEFEAIVRGEMDLQIVGDAYSHFAVCRDCRDIYALVLEDWFRKNLPRSEESRSEESRALDLAKAVREACASPFDPTPDRGGMPLLAKGIREIDIEPIVKEWLRKR